jgi:predicted DCC family thiol-disulfide oxidoreductase YuxK
MSDSSPRPRRPLTVLYDGACPLCSREIAWYRRRTACEPIDWLDIGTSAPSHLPRGVSREQAMARFHVIAPDGSIVTGARAFVRLWKAFPGLKRLALLARLPLVEPLMEWGYRVFLIFRPLLPRGTAQPARPPEPPAAPDCTTLKQ